MVDEPCSQCCSARARALQRCASRAARKSWPSYRAPRKRAPHHRIVHSTGCDIFGEECAGVIDAVGELSKSLFVDDITEGLVDQQDARQLLMLVAEPTKELIGFVSYSLLAPVATIEHVAVSEAHRRYGYASMLIDAVADKVRQSHVGCTILHVRPTHSAAGFYERCGFAKVLEEDLQEHYGRCTMAKCGICAAEKLKRVEEQEPGVDAFAELMMSWVMEDVDCDSVLMSRDV